MSAMGEIMEPQNTNLRSRTNESKYMRFAT